MQLYIGHGQNTYWRKLPSMGIRNEQKDLPKMFSIYELDFDSFYNLIKNKISKDQNSPIYLDIPMGDDRIQAFILKSTPVFEDSLSNRYPGFYSLTGTEVGKSGLAIKMSVSPFGLHVFMSNPDGTIHYIDPIMGKNTNEYIVYKRIDILEKSRDFLCKDLEAEAEIGQIVDQSTRFTGDCSLRTYRLALACTGEYARFHGGTKERVLDAFNTTLTRVNGIYERDLSITFKLVSANDKLIFLDPLTDPYNNGDVDIMGFQNEKAINDIIGFSNYDIGHVFGLGNGGLARIRSACTTQKAMGVTGLENPIGDPFDIDYVAHELGHQLGGDHTHNNDCQRNTSISVEPGSGSTIMAYTGICAPNVQSHSDPYFHGVSLTGIASYTALGQGNTCGIKSESANNRPVVSVQNAFYSIPVSTPFFLEAHAIDIDGDSVKYCWEQLDNQITPMPPQSNNAIGPLFRSILPSTQSVRYFPDVTEKYGMWEVLPSVTRTMTFQCTVRDNHASGGCTAAAKVTVQANSDAGPFKVTNPSKSGIIWPAGSIQQVSWDVAKTNALPVNCKMVHIFLSVDGGKTYPVLLLKDTPNDGSADIIVPDIETSRARIRVIASDNIFFDVSDFNFQIYATFSMTTPVNLYVICTQSTEVVKLKLDKLRNLETSIRLAVVEKPASLSVSFSNSQVDGSAEVTMVFQDLHTLMPGTHEVFISATSGNERHFIKFFLHVEIKNSTPPVLLFPPDNSSVQLTDSLTLLWKKVSGIQNYLLQMSENPSFTSLKYSVVIQDTFYKMPLERNKVYYWKIKPQNACLNTDFSHFFTFGVNDGEFKRPKVLSNALIPVGHLSSTNITNYRFNVECVHPERVKMTLLSLPMNGAMRFNHQQMLVGDTFSLADMIQNKISYIHTTPNSISDSIILSLKDDNDRWLSGVKWSFQIIYDTFGLIAYVSKPPTCHGDKNAMINLEGYGGIRPYKYSLDGVSFFSDSTVSNVQAGKYTGYIKDSSGKMAITSQPIEIVDVSEITLDLYLEKYTGIALARGGFGLLTYSVDNTHFYTDSIFRNVSNGNFTVYVKDDYGCIASKSIMIDIPPLKSEMQIIRKIHCDGEDAVVSIKASGGIPPYKFSSDGYQYSENTNFVLKPGLSFFYTKDSGGKIIKDTFRIDNPKPILITVIQDHFTITLQASGGTGILKYGTDGINFTTLNRFTFSENGTYRLYVIDENYCIQSTLHHINVLKDVEKVIRNVSCYSKKDGYISLKALNGSQPFLYSLNGANLSSQNEWKNLEPGKYLYKILDAKNDSIFGEIIISQPDSLWAEAAISKSDLTVLAKGGTPPYLYSIDGGLVFLDTHVFNELPSGHYDIVVKDKNQCVFAITILITAIDEEDDAKNLTIFPVPTRGNFYIKTTSTVIDDFKIEVFNLNGQSQGTCSASPQSTYIWNVESRHLLPGIYFLQIKLNGKHIIRKIVVI